MRRFVVFCCVAAISFSLQAQKSLPVQYPSLLWEITGKGLSRPSYLFGTMHVSSKMAFHLSDSFYHALSNCDVVALELNPHLWQRDMMRMETGRQQIADYMKNSSASYVNEKSFRLEKYEDNLRTALTEDPLLINGLLYRTFQTQADYEENTYLDLYIYQTGRKLGKQAGGVEDYYETEKTVLEAYQDMAKEKMRKKPDTDGEPEYEIQRKIQDAYRSGNLDLLDSLEKITFNSPAYLEKFLYKRNEIQAYSIDTILQKHSLFVGVGAAHLPGKRGVIELLRQKGYHLRPIPMQDRDAEKKDTIDQLRVPVSFRQVYTADSTISMLLPGPLYKRSDSRALANSSWQYADMDNGTYYMLTRVNTRAAFLGQPVPVVLKKVDSLLYENIPGKIIRKTAIVRNGYPGFDITNRTRRGDLQRYHILVTPFEVLVFKMSGNDNYVSGKEADTFFNSIAIRPLQQGWVQYQPPQGGFTVRLPQQPHVFLNTSNTDRVPRWEYAAVDSAVNQSYAVWKKDVHNYYFLEEDTFDLALVEESVKRAELVEKQLQRKALKKEGYEALDMLFVLKGGGRLRALAVLQGPHYYLLLSRNGNPATEQAFFNSFHFTGFRYAPPALYTDTVLHFSVQTPVQPVLDSNLVKMVNATTSDEFLDQIRDHYTYWPLEKYAGFKNDTTGEAVLVRVKQYPKYFYSKDSATFWKTELDGRRQTDWVVKSKTPVTLYPGCSGYKMELRDTNTVRKMMVYSLLKDNRLYRVYALTDTVAGESSFIRGFFDSFRPDEKNFGPSVFENKKDRFFADYNSPDSVTRKKARSAISSVYFGATALDQVMQAIGQLKYGDKDYFELKSRWITELGFIKDSCCTGKVLQHLAALYNNTADTSYFQNEVLRALAHLRTKESYQLLKTLLVQDPPVFEDDYGYSALFNTFKDSLALTRSLLPDVLQLSTLEDYRLPVVRLLSRMADSGYLHEKDYESYYNKLYFDAKIELKRQQNRDERLMEKQDGDEDDDDDDNRRQRTASDVLEDYATLLIPFYGKNPAVNKYFDKLLQSKNPTVQLTAAAMLVQNRQPVPDSLLQSLAAKDAYRARLLKKLETAKQPALFPSHYRQQEMLARSVLLNDKSADRFAAIELLGKQQVKTKEQAGWVYCYKYKLKKEDDWKIGLSGIQPLDTREVSSNDLLVSMTDKKLKADVPVNEQVQEQLKKLLFAKHKSAEAFFEDNSYARMGREYLDRD